MALLLCRAFVSVCPDSFGGNSIDEPLFMDRTTYEDNVTNFNRYYYIHDNLGSVAALADTSGNVVEIYKYSPWGEPTIYSGSGEIKNESQFENPYLFTGREVYIPDSGMLKLQINRHRILNYPLARWMTADPLGVVPGDYMNDFNPLGQYADGVNIYQYVGNEPVIMPIMKYWPRIIITTSFTTG